jgi:hypothetical protein
LTPRCSHSPSAPPPSFTQSTYPPRSLVRDGQTSPHSPRLVISRSTCPPLSSPPPREQLFTGSCSNKTHGTTVINTTSNSTGHRVDRLPRSVSGPGTLLNQCQLHKTKEHTQETCGGSGYDPRRKNKKQDFTNCGLQIP